MIVELKGSSVKERHWKQLMKKLRVVWVLSDLTLGQVCYISILVKVSEKFSDKNKYC